MDDHDFVPPKKIIIMGLPLKCVGGLKTEGQFWKVNIEFCDLNEIFAVARVPLKYVGGLNYVGNFEKCIFWLYISKAIHVWNYC